MNTNNNGYTIIYATIMVIIVALMLALVSSALKDTQTANVELDKKKQILNTLQIDLEGKDAAAIYDEYIVKELVINIKAEVLDSTKFCAFKVDFLKELAKNESERKLPVYVANVKGKLKYIMSLKGSGLWGPIWGYVALNEDRNSIYGSYFSHASETPGLGAEIAYKEFQNTFIDKKILDTDFSFKSILVLKPDNKPNSEYEIDGISGGTITSKAVEKMLFNCLGQYKAFYVQKVEGGTK
jgi:Na+-transporting NADH:ubiquinone oxidoreductase subunit C